MRLSFFGWLQLRCTIKKVLSHFEDRFQDKKWASKFFNREARGLKQTTHYFSGAPAAIQFLRMVSSSGPNWPG
jgi:hypothetical protein